MRLRFELTNSPPNRILFSLLICGLFVVVGVRIDTSAREIAYHNARNDAATLLNALRTRMEQEFDVAERVSRGLGLLISEAGYISQETYAEFASVIADDLPGVINIAWAPNLVVTHVFPIKDNEMVIGLDYRTLDDQIKDVQLVRTNGTSAIVGPVQLVQGRLGIILRLPVFFPSQTGARATGVLSLVYDLEEFVEARELEGQVFGLDVALTTDAGDFSSGEQVVGDPAILMDNPVEASLIIPEREWRLHARPVSGWDTAASVDQFMRFSLLAIVGLAMVLSVSAYWLASSRKSSIQKMTRMDAQLDSVIRSARGVFFSYIESETGRGKLDYISETCRDIWGLEAAELCENPELVLEQVSEEQQKLLLAEFQKARDTMQRWTYTWKTKSAAGRAMWLQGWAQPNRISDDTVQWYGFIVDVTQSREKDLQLEQQAAIVLQTQKQDSIGHLTGGVAHDFNNLLAVIMGNLELLRDEVSVQDHLNLIDACLKATKRGASLTGNMLAFARKARLEPRVIDPNEMVRETCEWIVRTLPSTIDVEATLSRDIWMIKADPSSTESALLNLILNARDAMPQGGKLSIKTSNVWLDDSGAKSLSPDLNPGGYVVLDVSDQGQGIAAELLPQIFEPFFSTKPPGSGSGLGLSMIQGFLYQSGGTVSVQSKVGEGTTFSLYFPASEPALSTVVEPIVSQNEDTFVKNRVLVVEDEKEVRQILLRTLQTAGYDVTVAASGDEALEVFEAAQKFDLVVSDIVMPGKLQGPDLLQRLRARDPSIPAIFISGYSSEATEEGKGFCTEDIRLMKPVRREDLLKAVHTLLG